MVQFIQRLERFSEIPNFNKKNQTLHLYRQHNTKKKLNNYKTTQTSTHGFQYNHTKIFNQTSLELFLHIHIVYISNNHHDS